VSSEVEARLRTEDAGMVIATCARERSVLLHTLTYRLHIIISYAYGVKM
jgi:hypothetical protein